MRSINPKCTNNESFKYSILISLHYYELENLENFNSIIFIALNWFLINKNCHEFENTIISNSVFYFYLLNALK